MSSAGISFGGLASGLDTQAIITALTAIERRPINQLEAKKTALGKQKSLFGDLDGLLDKLASAAKKLKTTSSFLSMKAASDNEDILTASASSSATPGTHRIEVLQLARAQVNNTNGHASATSQDFGNYGEFLLDVGGNQVVISVSNPTLQNIADAINNTGAEITAEVVDTGATTNPYQLVVRSRETGEENGFTISNVTGDQGFIDLIGELTTNEQSAENAHILLNGVNIYRQSNVLSGAVPGVTINLKSETTPPEEINLTISTDAEDISKKVQAFVDAYNGVVDFFKTQNALNEEGKAKSDLFGDSTLRSMSSSLRSIVGSAVATTGNEAYQMLAQIGIESDRDGKLTFTASELEEALSEDEAAVSKIFTDATNGISKRLEDQIEVYTDSVEGLIKTRLEGFDRQIKQATDRIDQSERRLELYRKRLEVKYANLESLLARLQGQGSSVGNITQRRN